MCKVFSFSFFDFLIPYLLNLFLKQSNVKRDHLTCELGKGKSIRLLCVGLSAWLQRLAETFKYLQTLGSPDFQTRWLSIWFNTTWYAGTCRGPMDSYACNILWGKFCLGPDMWPLEAAILNSWCTHQIDTSTPACKGATSRGNKELCSASVLAHKSNVCFSWCWWLMRVE